jgi:alpha-mannosidase
MWRGIGLARQPTQAMRFEAPHFVEVGNDQRRITILNGGLPYHQRSGSRMLDTLLIVAGETARTFRMGIGVDLAHPLPAALELLVPYEPLVARATCPRGAPSGWLLHVDAKNVVVTHCAPLVDAPPPGNDEQESHRSGISSPPGSHVCGFRIRLLETEGRAGRVFLSSFRNIASATRTNLRGESLADLSLDGGRVAMHVGSYEWLQIEARWSRPES